MLDGIFIDLLAALLGCAVLLGGVSLYLHYTDAEVIDEEEEAAVEHETPEERAQSRLAEEAHERERALESFDERGYSDSE